MAKNTKFNISIKPKKAWFGEKNIKGSLDISNKQPKLFTIVESKLTFKNNQPWNTESKILVGSLIALVVIGIIIAFVKFFKKK